jgi:hypothetical protein
MEEVVNGEEFRLLQRDALNNISDGEITGLMT